MPVPTDVPRDVNLLIRMAQLLADSDLIPSALRRRPANVLLVLMGARALNVPAFQALQTIHVIEGKLTMGADLMRALVNRASHQVRVVERTADRATVEIKRHDRDQPYRATFTRQDAATAELLGKGNWKKYPAAMLVARATAIAVRDECPEVLLGISYTPDELGAITDERGIPVISGEVVEEDPPPAQPEPTPKVTPRPPTPDELRYAQKTLVEANVAGFPSRWGTIVAYGWTADRVPDTTYTLTDLAVQCLDVLGVAATTITELRAVWEVAKVCRLLDRQVITNEAGQTLKYVLTAYGDQLMAADQKRAAQDVAAEGPPPVLTDAEQEHVRRTQDQAAASWGETDGSG